jgi:hypothetical protein
VLAVLQVKPDQPGQQRGRKQLPEYGFEIGEAARERMYRLEIAKTGGGDRRQVKWVSAAVRAPSAPRM